jgi:excisionase family DNA binding protein
MKKTNINRLTLSTYLSDEAIQSGDWISQAEAARIRGVSRQAIARLVKKGRLRALRIAGKVLLKRSDVKSFERERPGRRRKWRNPSTR